MTKPRDLDSDGTDLSVPERLDEAARLLRAHPASPRHAEVIKLLTLATLRLARLEAATPADWGDTASPYMTLSTLGAHLNRTDYFSDIPPLEP